MSNSNTINYNYVHNQTESTTGYFACEPAPAPSLADLPPMLAASPYDSFLRRYILGRFAVLDAPTIAKLLQPYLEGENTPTRALFAAFAQELALIAPALSELAKDYLNNIKLPDASLGSPLLYLRHAALPDAPLHAAWAGVFAQNIHGHRKLPEAGEIGLPPLFSAQYLQEQACVSLAALAKAPALPEQPAALMPAEEVAELALDCLRAAGAVAGEEQRHVASLSPIALLMPWRLSIAVKNGSNNYTLKGTANTYGRGLSLPQARASCRMEMVERFSAYLSIDGVEVTGRAKPTPLRHARLSELTQAGLEALDPNRCYIEAPYADEPLMWIEGHRARRSSPSASAEYSPVWVPLQMASLFCNCAEVDLCSAPGSTGIATGSVPEQAKLAALYEIMERDAEATTLYRKERCFQLNPDSVADAVLRGLLEDYRAQGVNVQFMDMTGALGLPCYQAFVIGQKGSVHRGHGASLSGARALVSALTETPYPYPGGGASGPMLRKLPERGLADLPDYSRGHVNADLALLEHLLCANGRDPVYVDLTHDTLKFPVVRAIVPGLEPSADFDEFTRVSARLYANYLRA